MSYQDSEQVKDEHISKLGEDFGSIYNALYNECVWVNLKWQKYTGLFGTSEKRLEILNRTAPTFFGVVQGALWDDTLLHLCRLSDPPKSMGKDNLTIQLLPPYITDESFRNEISTLINEAIDVTSFARDWRNRLIAHKDLTLKLDKAIIPLKSASRLKVKQAIQATCKVINEISLKYFDASIVFEPFEQPGGVRDLLIHLNRSVFFEEKREQRIRNKQFLPEDLHDEALSID